MEKHTYLYCTAISGNGTVVFCIFAVHSERYVPYHSRDIVVIFHAGKTGGEWDKVHADSIPIQPYHRRASNLNLEIWNKRTYFYCTAISGNVTAVFRVIAFHVIFLWYFKLETDLELTWTVLPLYTAKCKNSENRCKHHNHAAHCAMLSGITQRKFTAIQYVHYWPTIPTLLTHH